MRAAVAQWLPQAQMPEMLTQLISCAWDEAASPFPREGTLHAAHASTRARTRLPRAGAINAIVLT